MNVDSNNHTTMKAVVLNDTRTQFHHGCELVMRRIEHELQARNINIIAFSDEGENWQQNNTIRQAIKAADVVVVNGEGTIHHGRETGEWLLQVSEYAAKLGVPSFLINCTYESNPDSFKQWLQSFEGIFVRESESQKELAKIGVVSTIAPDLTLSSALENFNSSASGIVVSDSTFTQLSQELLELSRQRKWHFAPTLRSGRYEGQRRPKELARRLKFKARVLLNHHRLESLSYLAQRMHYAKRSITAFSIFIGHHELLISGRFHANCFALLSGTPIVVLDSNSHKVRSMLNDIGLRPDRLLNELSDLPELDDQNLIQHYQYSDEEIKRITSYMKRAHSTSTAMFDSIQASALAAHSAAN